MPKSLFQKYREGLMIGSVPVRPGSCTRPCWTGKAEADIARIVNFYDYLEIQPSGNNKFMINEERDPDINSIEDDSGSE